MSTLGGLELPGLGLSLWECPLKQAVQVDERWRLSSTMWGRDLDLGKIRSCRESERAIVVNMRALSQTPEGVDLLGTASRICGILVSRVREVSQQRRVSRGVDDFFCCFVLPAKRMTRPRATGWVE